MRVAITDDSRFGGRRTAHQLSHSHRLSLAWLAALV